MAGEYHSKDFDWDELRQEIENDLSLLHHLTPFVPSSSSSSPPPATDSEAWRSFHRRHSTGRFFKERRYLLKEFPELAGFVGSPCKVLEVGCGNGSTALPILRARQDIFLYACDCSMDALEMSKQMVDAADITSIGHRFLPFLLDFCVDEFPQWLLCNSCRPALLAKQNYRSDAKDDNFDLNSSSSVHGRKCCIVGVDFVTMIFTLSAITFSKIPFVIRKCFSVLKPGGLLFFRDYGLYDMTMLRFSPNQRVGTREYTRSDGTLSYFFSLEVTRDLFRSAGFLELELEYCCVRSLNHRSGKKMHRVWIHGKFLKPILGHTP